MAASKHTPMMEQYLSIKKEYPDTILFYRMGDFYEMFDQDAVRAAGILEITLTSRNKNAEDPIPMCGVPVKAADTYIARLIEGGCKVAVCEQVEDPALAKGLVKRQVVRVITPGMILSDSLLDTSSNNYILALGMVKDYAGLACLDISTGNFRTCQVPKKGNTFPGNLVDEALKLSPSEVLLPQNLEEDPLHKPLRQLLGPEKITFLPRKNFKVEDAVQRLCDTFQTRSLHGFGLEHCPASISAAGAILSYVRDTQLSDTSHLFGITSYELGEFLVMDERSCRNLELLNNIQTRDQKGSLVSILDHTVTAMGKRMIRHWIRYPLIDPEQIQERLNTVEEIVHSPQAHEEIMGHLKAVYDLERLGSRISMGQGNARDLLALKKSLQTLPDLFHTLEGLHTPWMSQELSGNKKLMDRELSGLAQLIESAIREDAVMGLNEGRIIKDGYSKELDELLAISRDGKSWIAQAQAKEKERTGLSSLKIKYNKVFGYFIEVSKSQASSVPEDYIRKQTLVNAERFITQDMKEVEATIVNAQDKRCSMEYEIFCSVRDQVVQNARAILQVAGFVARIDTLQGLARAAVLNSYVKPEINQEQRISIEQGRHPVVEKMITAERYVPNSIELDNNENQVLLITGPNMAGKSTVLRQVALSVLMAQMGSFVPAKKASLCIVDRIFTRVGALDNLSSGQSTFMVEMEETANIVNNATSRSLVILDEIGRGTSTFDGMSIAWAVARFLHDLDRGKGVKTLFATHYHELTRLADTNPRIKNFHISVKEFQDNIVFLRSLVPGATNKSYGIQVAKLAGLPTQIIETAKQVLAHVEETDSSDKDGSKISLPRESDTARVRKGKKKARPHSAQMELFPATETLLETMLRQKDLNQMTPMDALNFLHEMKTQAGI